MDQHDWMTNLAHASGRADVGADFGGLFGRHGWFRQRLRNPVRSIKALGRQMANTSKDLKRKIGKIPVVGKGLAAVYQFTPGLGQMELAGNIVKGDRIDHALLHQLRQDVGAAKDVAPYVQTVISVVPGVGQGISGAIGAATALASGRPISDALIEAARGAVPGGPAATAAFDVATAAVKGKPIDEVMVAALPLPPEQKKAVVTAAHAARDIAQGKRVDKALYEAGKQYLPPAAQKAFDTGLALAHGQNLQKVAGKALGDALPQLGSIGDAVVKASPMLKSGVMAIEKTQPKVAAGFKLGTGFLQHKVGLSDIANIRARLTPDELKGFDMAASVHVGKLTAPKVSLPPNQQFGFFLTHGMQGATPKHKAAMMTTAVNAHPEVRKGAALGIVSVKSSKSWWERVKLWAHTHFHKNPPAHPALAAKGSVS